MSRVVDLEKLFHRSKKRIKELGEVFTPEPHVTDMLNLLAKEEDDLWSDEDIAFFEPCSGHGNIVLPIYKRRLEGFYRKAISGVFSNNAAESACYAVANALNTLWAIDIDSGNIENCRSRVLSATLDFLKIRHGIENDVALLSRKKIFFAHVLSAIKWHIRENETLSALSHPENAKTSAYLTKAGANWFSTNGHHPLHFDQTWVNFYQSRKTLGAVPLEYKRSLRFVENILTGKLRDFEGFEFAAPVINLSKTAQNFSCQPKSRPEKSLSVPAGVQ